MRWFWFDKFLEFESGKRAVAIKNLTLICTTIFPATQSCRPA